jgi:hypothetical protein
VRITSNEEEPPLTSTESLDRTSRLVALVVDGMDLQMLALPRISTDLALSPVKSGAISTLRSVRADSKHFYPGEAVSTLKPWKWPQRPGQPLTTSPGAIHQDL